MAVISLLFGLRQRICNVGFNPPIFPVYVRLITEYSARQAHTTIDLLEEIEDREILVLGTL